VVVAAVAATAHSHTLAAMVHSRPGLTLLALFLVLAAFAFLAARWLSGLFAFSFGSSNWFFSLLFGLVTAWAIAHMVLRTMMMLQGEGGEVVNNLANSPVAREIYSFRTWKALMRLLFGAKLGPDFDPDVG
jgi:hypothetical protein